MLACSMIENSRLGQTPGLMGSSLPSPHPLPGLNFRTLGYLLLLAVLSRPFCGISSSSGCPHSPASNQSALSPPSPFQHPLDCTREVPGGPKVS